MKQNEFTVVHILILIIRIAVFMVSKMLFPLLFVFLVWSEQLKFKRRTGTPYSLRQARRHGHIMISGACSHLQMLLAAHIMHQVELLHSVLCSCEVLQASACMSQMSWSCDSNGILDIPELWSSIREVTRSYEISHSQQISKSCGQYFYLRHKPDFPTSHHCQIPVFFSPFTLHLLCCANIAYSIIMPFSANSAEKRWHFAQE